MTDDNEIKEPPIGECDYYDMVREFHKLVGHPCPDEPYTILREERVFRANLLMEEVLEFVTSEDLVEQVDAVLDLIYFAFGILVMMGVDPRELFDIVHQSNLGKLWPDGTFHYNEKGKVVKPALWERPEPQILNVLVKRMAESERGKEIPF